VELRYASQRYYVLEAELEFWGYDVVRHGRFSRWDEQVALAPLTGLVQIRGEREQGGLRLTFTITESWVLGKIAGRHQAQGVSLDGYHYHGQAGPDRRIRWCLDDMRHPEHPSHVHRFDHADRDKPDPYPPITAEEALQIFEQLVLNMIDVGELP
jgi:hypothetical protein